MLTNMLPRSSSSINATLVVQNSTLSSLSDLPLSLLCSPRVMDTRKIIEKKSKSKTGQIYQPHTPIHVM